MTARLLDQQAGSFELLDRTLQNVMEEVFKGADTGDLEIVTDVLQRVAYLLAAQSWLTLVVLHMARGHVDPNESVEGVLQMAAQVMELRDDEFI